MDTPGSLHALGGETHRAEGGIGDTDDQGCGVRPRGGVPGAGHKGYLPSSPPPSSSSLLPIFPLPQHPNLPLTPSCSRVCLELPVTWAMPIQLARAGHSGPPGSPTARAASPGAGAPASPHQAHCFRGAWFWWELGGGLCGRGDGGGGLRAQALLLEHGGWPVWGTGATSPNQFPHIPHPLGHSWDRRGGNRLIPESSVSRTLVPRSFQRAGKPRSGWGFPPVFRAWCPATGTTCPDLQRDPELPECWAPHLAPLGLTV